VKSQIFGHYLLERGVIHRNDLLQAMQGQASRQPSCAMAIRNKYFTPGQLASLDELCRSSALQCMDIVIQNNMLSDDQLSSIRAQSPEQYDCLGESLLDRRYITAAELDRLLEQYLREPGLRESDLFDDAVPLPFDSKVARIMVDTSLNMFLHYTSQIIRLNSYKTLTPVPTEDRMLVSQEITGDLPMMFILSLPTRLVLPIASKMMGEEQLMVDDVVKDALSEFVNIITGNSFAGLSHMGLSCSSRPPREMASAEVGKFVKGVAVRLNAYEGDLPIDWFSYFAVDSGLTDAATCRAILLNISGTSSLDNYARALFDSGICPDYDVLAAFVEQAMILADEGKSPPRSIYEDACLGGLEIGLYSLL
jgi:chemotaxis protein CheY-P-specific phosphatase CheC